jgi:hypothetical protein
MVAASKPKIHQFVRICMQASHACFGGPGVCVWEFAFMADLEAVETRLSFDDILEAVQDSRRGRWFLQEYETRIHKRDSSSILQAISRLENRMESMGPQASSPDDLARVRSAISKARQDILNLGLGKEALSKEGRLFADLAEMARKAMPVAVDSNAGIVRTLQLVDEIDCAISASGSEDRGAKYFSADANLFEKPATMARPVLVPATVEPEAQTIAAAPAQVAAPAPAKKEDAPITGAKLVIRKGGQSAEALVAPPPAAIEPPVATVEPAAEAEIPAAPEMPAIDNPRIVIVRRRAEDMPDVSMNVQVREETAA